MRLRIYANRKRRNLVAARVNDDGCIDYWCPTRNDTLVAFRLVKTIAVLDGYKHKVYGNWRTMNAAKFANTYERTEETL